LKELCLNPTRKRKGRELEGLGIVKNASQAAKKIRDTLEAAHAGAGQWLRATPYLHWAEGRVPRAVAAQPARV
jgi:hypothetical protein